MIMKNHTILLLIMLPSLCVAQGVFTNHAHTALQKVINDFPNNFSNIRGGELTSDLQNSDFVSKVEIPGSQSTVITQYGSDGGKEIYSWKAVISESEEFEEAAKKYHELYSQIKNSIIKIGGEKPFILSGSYEQPTESKKFSSTAFSLLPSTGILRNLKVELTLQNYITEWQVALLVYEQQDEQVVFREE